MNASDCIIPDLPHVDIRSSFELVCCQKESILNLDEVPNCETVQGYKCSKESECKSKQVIETSRVDFIGWLQNKMTDQQDKLLQFNRSGHFE